MGCSGWSWLFVPDGTTATLACDEFTPSDCGWGVDLQVGFGGLLSIVSVPFLVSGLPLLATGQHRLQHARALEASVGVAAADAESLQLQLSGSF